MTEREPPYGDDEPIIGVNYPGYDTPAEDAYGDDVYGAVGAPEPRIGADPWDDDYYGDPYEDPYDDYYYDEYYDGAPARQPAFYVFVGAALLLGGLLVFLLFQFLGGNNESEAQPTAAPDFNISIDQPLADERITANEDVDARIRANSTEHIARLELLVNGQPAAEQEFEEAPSDGIYTAELTFSVSEAGRYTLTARATSESGATAESDPIEISAVESIGDERPSRITGEAVSNVNARSGPGDDFEAERTIQSGDSVVVVGRSQDDQWLLLDDGTWVRRAGIRLSESPELLDVVEPTPDAEATETPTPDPSPSPSPTPAADVPDFAPANASLDSGGEILSVTISNRGDSAYQGPLVIFVNGLPGGGVEQAFSVNIGANSSTTVDLALSPAVTEGATIRVDVDPDNAVEETTEDNNSSSFTLSAPVQPPDISISNVSVDGNQVTVSITNAGGELPSSSVSVTVSIGGAENETSRQVALASGQSANFQLMAPAEGDGIASVSVGGEQVASAAVSVGGDSDNGENGNGDDNSE
ncbi:MAG: CARDB domain-containing protein [Dehalococcoidia bacterium]|nr:CARDB domain-containing protein [Dehalococcoidia bacterium]